MRERTIVGAAIGLFAGMTLGVIWPVPTLLFLLLLSAYAGLGAAFGYGYGS